jgi:hypothetical protein
LSTQRHRISISSESPPQAPLFWSPQPNVDLPPHYFPSPLRRSWRTTVPQIYSPGRRSCPPPPQCRPPPSRRLRAQVSATPLCHHLYSARAGATLIAGRVRHTALSLSVKTFSSSDLRQPHQGHGRVRAAVRQSTSKLLRACPRGPTHAGPGQASQASATVSAGPGKP